MRILLIAYEFPPSPSPQSLRWAYLSRELVRHGHEVHVLTADLGPGEPLEPIAGTGQLIVHRTYAGPVRGLIAARRKARMQAAQTAYAAADDNDAHAEHVATPRPRRSTWLTRWVQRALELSSWVRFPDVRAEWRRPGRRAAVRLMQTVDFDAVVCSHEPATSLQVALTALEGHAPALIVDLGDPVLAPYTLRHWRGTAARLESRTCRRADAITVTTDAAARLLVERHGPLPVHVVTQGFRDRERAPMPTSQVWLDLAYAGSFYAFRSADALFRAVAASDGVRLSVATVALPESLAVIARAHPEKFRMLGFLSHADALALQDSAHVLINIANESPTQVPGKLYEYLGAARPILHVGEVEGDAGGALVIAMRRGWTCGNDTAALQLTLDELRTRQLDARLLEGIDLSIPAVGMYSWDALGARYESIIAGAVAGRRAALRSGPPRPLHSGQ